MTTMSILSYLDPSHRGQPEDELPRFKESCCMKFTVEKEGQCKRCPFRQITDRSEQEQALKNCQDRRRGKYKWKDIEIEYNNQYC
ncbi:MAG: hypothetical protein Q8O95_04315 [bacterium]|nr:hypothetical protein [bacterium]